MTCGRNFDEPLSVSNNNELPLHIEFSSMRILKIGRWEMFAKELGFHCD
jgi:hypothetical protein